MSGMRRGPASEENIESDSEIDERYETKALIVSMVPLLGLSGTSSSILGVFSEDAAELAFLTFLPGLKISFIIVNHSISLA